MLNRLAIYLIGCALGAGGMWLVTDTGDGGTQSAKRTARSSVVALTDPLTAEPEEMTAYVPDPDMAVPSVNGPTRRRTVSGASTAFSLVGRWGVDISCSDPRKITSLGASGAMSEAGNRTMRWELHGNMLEITNLERDGAAIKLPIKWLGPDSLVVAGKTLYRC